MSFLNTGYGYRLSQNLTSFLPQSQSGKTSRDLVSVKMALSSRVISTTTPTKNLKGSNLKTEIPTTPKYKSLTYQLNPIRPKATVKDTMTNELFRDKPFGRKSSANNNPIPARTSISVKDYLNFFILKTNHLKNEAR